MSRGFPPKWMICGGVFVLSVCLQGSVTLYLNRLSHQQLVAETTQLKTQIAADLAQQLSTTLSGKDDLAALIIIKSARALHPQLLKAEVFAADGKIMLHTDPGFMNKTTRPYPGPHPASPETSHSQQEARALTEVLVPMPEQDTLFFRATFDDTRLLHAGQAYGVRAAVLAVLLALIVSLLVWLLLGRFELVDPGQKADIAPVAESHHTGNEKIRRLAELLLSELRQGAIAIDRNNKIIAANALALELLNCRSEELEGMHVLQAPLPKTLLEFYQASIQTPERVAQIKLYLASKEPGLPAKLICTPASQDWEVALISLA